MTGPQGMGPLIPGGGVPGVPGGGPGGGGGEDVDEGGIILPAGCNLILNEAFNSLSKWTVVGAPVIAAGRNGTGMSSTGPGATNYISYPIVSSVQSTTTTIGFAHKASYIGDQYFTFTLLRTGTRELGLTVLPTGGLNVMRNAAIIAASPTGIIAINTWYYIELQYFSAEGTAGWVKVKLNGNTVINQINVDTREFGNPDELRIHAATGGTAVYDDLYITSGSTCLFQGDHKISGPCKTVLNEQFNAFTTHGWVTSDGGGGVAPSIISNGRNGTAARLTYYSTAKYTISSTAKSDTMTIGLAWRGSNLASNPQILFLNSDNGTVIQCFLQVRSDGRIAGGSWLVENFNSAPGVITTNTWYYIEMQIKMHDTLGFVKVNVNGTTVINQSNKDTHYEPGAFLFDTLLLQTQGLGNFDYDDLYLTSGPGCSFQGDHIPGASCATVLNEPFDNLSKWGLAGAPAISPAGRNGSALTLTSGSSQYIYYDLSNNESDWLTVGAAFKFGTSWPVGWQPLQFRSDNGTTLHVNLNIDASGTLSLRVGSVTIGTYVTPLALDTWHYIETKIHLEGTNGSGIVRLNGATIISVNNIDTTNSGIKTVIDQIRIQSTGSSGSWYVDDLYITAGAGCSFQGDHPVLGPCMPVLEEAFDNLGKWTNSSCSIISGGRAGTCVNTPTTGEVIYTVASGNRADTFTIGFAWRRSDTADVNAREIFRFYGDDGATLHTKLFWGGDGQLAILRGTTQIATSDFSAMPSVRNTWYYIEAQVKLHDTAGFVKVRVDGVEVINATGLDTKNGGTGTVYDTLWLSGEAIYSTHQYDDLYLTTGASCGFQDDHPIVAPCTEILRDPMENYTNFVVSSGTPTLVNGRHGTAHSYSSTGAKTTYQIPADKQSPYLMLGFAAQCNYLPSGGYPVGFRTAAGTQGKLSYNSSGGVTWAKWTAADNPSGVNWSSAAGFMTPDTWHYIEIYIYLHDTAGSVLVAVDGVTAINVTGVNTLGHGTDTVFNRIEFGAQVTTINLVDDVYVRTGFGCSLQGDQSIGGLCMPVINEPFDNVSKWSVTGTAPIVAGRNGNAVSLTGNGYTVQYSIPSTLRSDYLTMGFAYKCSNLSAQHIITQLRNVAQSSQDGALILEPDGTLKAVRSAGTTFTLASSASGVITANTWYYIEMQWRLHDTLGWVVVRVDGVTVASATNVDTRIVSTVYGDIWLWSDSATTVLFDDFYLSTGVGCLFKGDRSMTVSGPFGAEQILDCTGAPNTTSTAWSTKGVKVSFAKDGQVTGIRYQRAGGPPSTLTFSAWRDSDQALLARTTDNQSLETTYTILFATPVSVFKEHTYTFTCSSDQLNTVPIGNLAPVISTADMTFIEFRGLDNNTHLYPTDGPSGVSYFVEPIYQPKT